MATYIDYMSNRTSAVIDTHAHVYDLEDPFTVLKDSAAAGVPEVVAPGVDLGSNQRHLEIREKVKGEREKGMQVIRSQGDKSSGGISFPDIHLALGLHPGNITPEEVEACFPFFREHIHEAVAIGETGLDYWYKWVRKDEVKRQEQRDVLERHLMLAKEFDLPVVIHSRGAWQDCLDMTVRAGVRKAEFHWYSGPIGVLKDILDAGFLVSCTPALEGSPELRKAMAFAPLDRIMVETDTPVAYRKFETRDTKPEGNQNIENSNDRNDRVPSAPKDVWRILRALAALKGVKEDEALRVVNANAREFFNI